MDIYLAHRTEDRQALREIKDAIDELRKEIVDQRIAEARETGTEAAVEAARRAAESRTLSRREKRWAVWLALITAAISTGAALAAAALPWPT